jgi:hypothetical protein
MGIADVISVIQEERRKSLESHISKLLIREDVIPPPTVDTVFRTSSLSNMCPREEVLAAKHQISRDNGVSADLVTTFFIGHHFETWFREDVLGPAGLLLGKWICHDCGYSADEVGGYKRYRQPKDCLGCGKTSKQHFIEESFYNKGLGLTGHNDGTIYWEDEYWLLELKTANEFNFGNMVKKGLPEKYIDQAQVYMDAFGHDRTMFIIQNKNSSKRVAIKIMRDSSKVKIQYQKLIEFRQCMKDGMRLPQRTCVLPTCPRAKGCPLMEKCFEDLMP